MAIEKEREIQVSTEPRTKMIDQTNIFYSHEEQGNQGGIRRQRDNKIAGQGQGER